MAIIDAVKEISPDNNGNDKVASLEEPKTDEAIDKENLEMGDLVSFIRGKFRKAKDQRFHDEQRWLSAYNNYRGLYSNSVKFTDTEKSRAFIKITKTKVLAAYAQLLDVLFSGNKFPLGIEAPKNPPGSVDSVHLDPDDPSHQEEEVEEPEDFTPSSIARKSILESIGLSSLKEKLLPVEEKIKEGPGKTPTSHTWEPAKLAAFEMEKLILDQLEEGQADKETRALIFEMCLFGTGVLKGPFAVDKEYARWDETGQYDPEIRTIPDFTQVSVWDSYPDPDGRNMKESELFIQRHRMSRTQLRALKKRPHFRHETIEKSIEEGPNYIREYWENDLVENQIRPETERWEVLEYWGIIDKELAEKANLDIPDILQDKDQVQINCWICGNKILRLVLNPFTPNRIPYYAVPYELNPYSFFGIGIAENMEDTQLLMNGFIRLAVDNATISSNVVFDIDETLLADGQDMKVFPGKIFRRQGGQPGTAINSVQIPNVTQECLLLFDKARQLSDEATGMPSYSHGMSGIMSTGRTAAGMSMLMGAAKENIKAVVRNLDDYLLVPFGKSMFAFNMQFNFDKKFAIGGLEVVAKGTDSLMRNEVRSQKLLQFLQLTSNPADMPFVKRDYILRELATSLDLDPDKVVNDPREAALQAEMMKEMQDIMGITPEGAPQEPEGNPAGMPGPQDPTGTGGGNIAPGMAPGPMEQGHTGAGGGMNSMPQQPMQ